MWLHGRSPATARAYSADAQAFLAFVAKPLAQVTVGDVQQFGSSLGHLATASQARSLSSVKSLLAFAHRLGYVPFNVGAVVRLPKIKNTLAERIMDEADVHRMLALETDARNAALLRLVYAAGLRVSEACSLRWRDLAANKEAGQANVFGKGGKTRTILLPASVWRGLQALRNDASPDAPLFPSRKGGSIGEVQAWRIVKAAAARAGLSRDVSTHWLRHAHASHALDRGAPIALVQATLGHANLATTGRYTHARPSESSSKYLAL
jgi:integrase/recombinase XerD